MSQTQTSQKLIFHNHSLIDPGAWELHGVSCKMKEGAVGQFGTGNCYYLAVLLRTGHKVTIKADDTIYEFGLKEMEFRGKTFQRVTCNGKELSFTTDYGMNWTVDQAYREIYSNCIDEEGIHFIGEPMEKGTSIIVEGEGIMDSMTRHDDLFVGDREPLFECSSLRVFEGKGVVYYRGVKVWELENAAFSYEILEGLDLTEDRTVKYPSQIANKVGFALCYHIKDRAFIERFIKLKNSWEAKDCDYEWSWSDTFMSVVREVWEKSPTLLNERVLRIFRTKCKESTFKVMQKTEDMELMIGKACEFLALAGYAVTAPIQIVENEDSNCIAFYYDGTIHLTSKSFDKGMFDLVTTLFEEQQHHVGYADESRGFQQFLIDELVTQTRKRLKWVL